MRRRPQLPRPCCPYYCLVQSVLDALRAKRERFVFEGCEIGLRHSAMAFITMNPGYPGRAELPESLKARAAPARRALRRWPCGSGLGVQSIQTMHCLLASSEACP